MLYDDILSEIGGWGRYQKTVCLLLAAATIPTGVFVMTPVFTTKTPTHRCRVPEIDNMANNSENIYNVTGLEMYIPWDAANGRYESCRRIDFNFSAGNSTLVACDYGYIYDGKIGELTATMEIAESIKTRKKSSNSSNGYFRKLEIPFLDLFIQPGIITTTLCSCFSWFVMSLIYVTLNFNSGNLAGDEYINCLIIAAVEIPAYLSVYLLLRTKGRRPVFFGYLGFSAICYLTIPLINNVTTTGAIACAMAGKFCISSAFSLVYIYTAELFPTEGRNQAMGLCSMCARAAGVIAPYIVYLGEIRSSDIPYYVTGGFAVAACFTNYFLPETLGTTLPDTYEEAANLKRSFHSRQKQESSII